MARAGWGALLSALAVSALAHGDEHAALVWDAPAGCPDRAFVAAEVDRLLGHEHAPGDAPVDVEARVVRSGATLKLVVIIRSGGTSSSRTLESSNCTSLANSAALIIAMSVNPDRVGAEPKAPPPVASVTAPSSVVAPLPTPPTRDAMPPPSVRTVTPAAPSIAVAASLGARIDFGAPPGADPGAQATFAIVRRALQAEMALGWLPRRTMSIDRPSAGASFETFSASPRIGWRTGSDVRFVALGGFDLSLVRARASGLRESEASSVLRPGISATAAGTIAIAGPLRIRADATLLLPLRRPTYFVDVLGEGRLVVATTPPALIQLVLGLEVDL